MCQAWCLAFCVDDLIWSSQHDSEGGCLILTLKMERLKFREGKWLAWLPPVAEPGFSFRRGWLPGPCSSCYTLFPRGGAIREYHLLIWDLLQIAIIQESFLWHEMLVFKYLEIWSQPTQVIGMILYFNFRCKRHGGDKPLSLGVQTNHLLLGYTFISVQFFSSVSLSSPLLNYDH